MIKKTLFGTSTGTNMGKKLFNLLCVSKVNPTWTDKIFKSNSPKLFMSTNSITTFFVYNFKILFIYISWINLILFTIGLSIFFVIIS